MCIRDSHLASFTSLLIMRSFFAYRQKSLFILGCVQGASISLVCLSVCLCPSCVTFVVFTDCESCTRPISTNPGSMAEECEYGLPSGTCFIARRLEVVEVAGLLWIYFVVCFLSVWWDFVFFYVFFT